MAEALQNLGVRRNWLPCRCISFRQAVCSYSIGQLSQREATLCRHAGDWGALAGWESGHAADGEKGAIA